MTQEHVMEQLLILLDLHLRLQFPLDLQLVVQLVLPLLEGDAAAAIGVFDPHSPVVDLLQEVAGTQLVLDPQNTRPVEVEDAMEDLWVPVKEVLIVSHYVVITQVQFHVVICVRGQPSYSGLGVFGCHLVSYLIGLPPDIDVNHIVLLGGRCLLGEVERATVIFFVLILGVNVIDIPAQLLHGVPCLYTALLG